MEKIILDSNTLIDILKNIPEVVEKVGRLKQDSELGTTDINVFELYLGAYKSKHLEKEIADVRGLLGTLFLMSTSEDSMKMAAKTIAGLEKKGKPIDLRDLFIGSICITHSCKLLTRNTKHFENIEGLEILEY